MHNVAASDWLSALFDAMMYAVIDFYAVID